MPSAPPGYPEYPTLIHALAKAAELRPNATGLVCEAREITYAQYAQAVAAMAQQIFRLWRHRRAHRLRRDQRT